jgi:predicted RNA binding protein YcfA (HicA-like mRNA interferase family)
MSKLPSSQLIIKVLRRHGFELVSQRGSHQKFRKGERIVIVPAERKEMPIGTFRSIMRQSGLTPKDFM